MSKSVADVQAISHLKSTFNNKHRFQELKGNIRLRFEGYSGEISKADRFIPEHSYTVDESDEEIDKDEIFKELREWRRNFEK